MICARRDFLASAAAFAALPSFATGRDCGEVSVRENPDGTATDPFLCRRLYLDLAGRIPTADEARAYVRDRDPARRAALVARLVASEDFTDYWTMRFADVLRVKSEFPINLWPNAVYVYHRRIREFVRTDESWPHFGRALVTGQGSNFRDAESNFFRAVAMRTPEGWAEAVAATFLGLAPSDLDGSLRARLVSPFADVAIKTTREWKEEIVYCAGEDRRAAFADDELFGSLLDRVDRAFCARVWQWFFGEGVPKVKAFAELHDDLPRLFVAGGRRLRPLVEAICLSDAYARGSATGGFPLRRLDAEVLDDAFAALSGTKRSYQSIAPEPFTFLPGERRSVKIEDGSITNSFLLLFGRPARDSGLAAERDPAVTAKQRLYLFNSGSLHARLGRLVDDPDNRAKGKAFRALPLRVQCARLYWPLLGRAPTARETAAIERHAAGMPRGERWRLPRDLAWCLVNTCEFLYRG